ncbi:MAG TPA: cupin domain-containing protein [Actinoplanes sp.]|nr:cupin domain-containing protein [Actinoplanes sp.]
MTEGVWIARAATAEHVQDGPTSELHLLADAQHTGGALTINRAILDVGSPGAPAHSHSRTTEAILVLDGSLDVLTGDRVATLTTGDLVVIQPGVVHAFAPTAGCVADMLAVYTPGQQRFEYYRLLERLYRGEATVDDLTAGADRYDNRYATSETWKRHRNG